MLDDDSAANERSSPSLRAWARAREGHGKGKLIGFYFDPVFRWIHPLVDLIPPEPRSAVCWTERRHDPLS